MSDRVEAAVRELAAALREELHEELRAGIERAPMRILSVAETCQALGLSRSVVAAAIADGRLRSVKVGRRRLIPQDALADFVTSSAA